MTNNSESRRPSDRSFISPAGTADEQQITLRSPAELADALPYMLGFHPSDSLVMVAVHGEGGGFGGRLRVGMPNGRTPPDRSPTASSAAANGAASSPTASSSTSARSRAGRRAARG